MLELASRQLAFTDTGRQRERFQHDRQKLFFFADFGFFATSCGANSSIKYVTSGPFPIYYTLTSTTFSSSAVA